MSELDCVMALDGFILSVFGSLLANAIIIIGKYMCQSNKHQASYSLVKKVYTFGFTCMFIVFGFSLFRSEGNEKIVPVIFLVISIIFALYTVIKNPYLKFFNKSLNINPKKEIVSTILTQNNINPFEYKQGSKYISGKELMTHWNMEGFELFNCLKKGLQPYTQYGHKIIDTDTLEHGRKHSVEWFENLISGTNETGNVFTGQSRIPVCLTNQEIKQQAKKTFEGQQLLPINPPSHHMSYALPNDNKKAAVAFKKIMELKFRKDEVLEFVKNENRGTNK